MLVILSRKMSQLQPVRIQRRNFSERSRDRLDSVRIDRRPIQANDDADSSVSPKRNDAPNPNINVGCSIDIESVIERLLARQIDDDLRMERRSSIFAHQAQREGKRISA